jgi:UDP-N-acetylglucosamine 4-epimerase
MSYKIQFKDVEFPENSTFIVTRGAGIIGSNLCEVLLEMGHKVVCLCF